MAFLQNVDNQYTIRAAVLESMASFQDQTDPHIPFQVDKIMAMMVSTTTQHDHPDVGHDEEAAVVRKEAAVVSEEERKEDHRNLVKVDPTKIRQEATLQKGVGRNTRRESSSNFSFLRQNFNSFNRFDQNFRNIQFELFPHITITKHQEAIRTTCI